MFLIFFTLALVGYLASAKHARILYRRGSDSFVLAPRLKFRNQAEAIEYLGDPDIILDTDASKLLIWHYEESYFNGLRHKLYRRGRIYMSVNNQGKVNHTKIFSRYK